MDRIINMAINMLMRMLTKKAMSAGMGYLSKRGQPTEPPATPEEAQARDAQSRQAAAMARRAKDLARANRRLF